MTQEGWYDETGFTPWEDTPHLLEHPGEPLPGGPPSLLSDVDPQVLEGLRDRLCAEMEAVNRIMRHADKQETGMNDQFPHDTASELVECPRCLRPISDHVRDSIGNGLVRYVCPAPGQEPG